jgi:tRNA-intron endonuclease
MDIFLIMITAHVSAHTIRSSSADAFLLCDKSGIGEKREGYVRFSPTEALFLLQAKKMQLVSVSNLISAEKALVRLKKIDSRVEEKCLVYSDMRKKGYFLKEGLKFGGDFRAYKSLSAHAPWIVHVISAEKKIVWSDFAAKSRVAHSTNKKVLLALVDSEGDISYYEVSWMKP